MQTIVRDFPDFRWSGAIRLYPFFDVHIGPAACDEAALDRDIQRVKDDPDGYWIGGGDYADFINRSDKRFDPSSLAPWVGMTEFRDMAKAQRDRVVEKFAPIADKCLCLLGGNHEGTILKYYERDIYGDLVNGVKEAAGLPETHKLALGYEGWLVLRFGTPNAKGQSNVRTIRIRLHHGYGGGRLVGAPALELERVLARNNCDLALMGHIHRRHIADPVLVEGLDKMHRPAIHIRKGAYCGTYLRTRLPDGPSTYAAVKGYYNTSIGCPVVTIRPFTENPDEVIRIQG